MRVSDPIARDPGKRGAFRPRWTKRQFDRFKATMARKSSGRSRLTDARIGFGWTIVDLSKRSDTVASAVCALETGRLTPRGTHGWIRQADAVADALGFTCEELWPEHAPKAPRFLRSEVPTPEALFADAEAAARVRAAVARLPPAHARVIAERFGLDGEPQGIEAIGRAMGFTRQRAHIIERAALATLAKMLRREGLHA